MHLNFLSFLTPGFLTGVLIGAQLAFNLFLLAHARVTNQITQSHDNWLDADADLLDHHLDRIHHLEGQVSEHEGRLNQLTPLTPTAPLLPPVA